MGVNECGVSIGNEAVFTKTKKKETGLLGMDMLRIALQRSRTAKQALEVITDLLQRYGQGGSNSFTRKYLYDNSFLISDRDSAWVLETAGDFWVAKEIHDYYSISNILTIHTDYDLTSKDLSSQARALGYWHSSEPIDFAKAFQDYLYSRLGKGSERLRETRTRLDDCASFLTPKFDMSTTRALLRTHASSKENFAKGNTGDVCMHWGGLLSPDQTAGSLISTFIDNKVVAFATGSSLPCHSTYIPHVVAGSEPVRYTSATSKYDPQSFWWELEKFHRADLSGKSSSFFYDLENQFEHSFIQKLEDPSCSIDILVSFSKQCYTKELDAVQQMCSTLPATKSKHWKQLNREATLPA